MAFQTDSWRSSVATAFLPNVCKTDVLQHANAEPSAAIAADVENVSVTLSNVSSVGCDASAKSISTIETEVFLLRSDSEAKGAGTCFPNKWQYAETIQFPDEEYLQANGITKKIAVGESSQCFPASIMESVYGTTSSMKPGSVEWQQFHVPETKQVLLQIHFYCQRSSSAGRETLLLARETGNRFKVQHALSVVSYTLGRIQGGNQFSNERSLKNNNGKRSKLRKIYYAGKA